MIRPSEGGFKATYGIYRVFYCHMSSPIWYLTLCNGPHTIISMKSNLHDQDQACPKFWQLLHLKTNYFANAYTSCRELGLNAQSRDIELTID